MGKNLETFFDGEKYISSKQAAELANYTSDYIGQLCRGNKIKARRIGRDWFVSESGLISYQNKLAGIEEKIEIKINKSDGQGARGQGIEKNINKNKFENLTLDPKILEPSFVSRQSRLSEVDDVYSFDISGDFSKKKKDFHLKELYGPKIAEQKFNFKSISRESRLPEEALAKVGQSDVNLFKTFAKVSGYFLLSLTKINHILSNWIEDRRYQKIKKLETRASLKLRRALFSEEKNESRRSRLPEFIKILAPIGFAGLILTLTVTNQSLIFEKGEKWVKKSEEMGQLATLYITEAPAKVFEMGYRGVNGIARAVNYSTSKKHKTQIAQNTNKTQDIKIKDIQNYFENKKVSPPYQGGARGGSLAQFLKPKFIDIPFSAEDLRDAIRAIPETLIFARDNVKNTFGMIGEEAKLLSQKIFFGAKILVENFISRKPIAKKEEPTKKIVIEYKGDERDEGEKGEGKFPLLTKEGRGEVESGIIRSILGRLSLVESRAGIGQISANDLAAINANIRADTKILIDSAISGIEKRIPPVAQNPVVFLTSSIPGPTSSSPPQVGSGVSAAFGEFSQSLGTSGDFKASGNITLGDAAKDTSIKSKTWNITSAGAGSGFVSFGSETLTVSGAASISGGLTAYGVSSFSTNLGIGTTSPGSILSVNQVGNFVASATSSLFYGLTIPGIHATSSGITISGGSILNTSTATSTFSGGIGLTSFSASNGLTISGGDILYEGALFRLTSGGSLGIGTTSPSSKLSVHNGGALIAGTTTVQHLFATSTLMVGSSVGVGDRFMVKQSGEVSIGSTTPFAFLAVENTGSALSFAINDQAADASPFVVDANGNVGIGTTTPVTTLDVVQRANGDIVIRGRRFTDTAPTGDLMRFTSADGNTNLFRVDNSGNITGGGVISSGAISILSTSQPQLRVQYDASNEVTTTVTSAGVTTFGFNGTTPTGTWTPQSNSINTFSFTNAASASVFSVDTTNQRVGIGTTTPGSILSIQGVGNFITHGTSTLYNPLTISGIKATSTGITISGGTLINTSTATSTFSGGISIGSAGGLTSGAGLTVTSGDILHTGATFRVTSGGNVGIGTTNPRTKLDIQGGVTDSIATMVAVFGTDVNAVQLGNDGTDAVIGVQNSATKLHLLSRSGGVYSRALTVDSAGNVGIGTTSPQTKLEVVNTSSGATADQLYLSNIASATSTASRLTFRANDITNGTSTANITSILTQNYNTGKGDLTFSTLRSGTLTEAMRILDTGFVGIGTTTPGSILSIQGVGNFITHGTSTLYNPLQVAGINATSSGITISGGTFINTSTATSTFSGGISATSLAGSAGLILSGGDLSSTGIYRFTGTATSTLSGGLSTAGLSSTAGLTLTGGTILSTGTGTSTFSGGIGATSLLASAGLSVTGGSILNTSTATSTFSGGIGATSLSASGGLTVSGGAILQTGGATSTILGLTSSGITSSSGFNITGGSISTNGLIYNTNTGTSTFSGGISIASAGGLTSGAGLTVTSGDILHTGATFRVTSGGNVGIGKTNPGAKLDVLGTATNFGSSQAGNLNLNLYRNNAAAQVAGMRFNGAISYDRYFGILTNTDTLVFGRNTGDTTVDQVVIDNGGNVGIGTTNPLQALHVVGQCVTGDTRLRRRRKKGSRVKGPASAEALAGKQEDSYDYDEVEIKDVKAGDEIASLDENTGNIVWMKVKKLLDMGVKTTYRLVTADGRQIRTTKEHPYLVKDSSERPQKHSSPISGAGWLAVEDIKTGDYIAVPRNRARKTTAFIDASNIIYGAKANGWKMDFAKLIKYLKTRFGAQEVFYYAGLDYANAKQIKFYEKLSELGYTLKLVPLKRFKNGKEKGDIDSRMTFEMMQKANTYDRAIVLTGDGDFYWMLEHLSKENKELKIASFALRTAREIKQLAGSAFTDIARLKHLLEFKENEKATDAFEGSAAGIMPLLYQGEKPMSSQGVDNNEIVWIKVERIEKVGEEQVYDIEVEGTHNFIGNDIVAHNTYMSNDLSIAGNEINLGTGAGTTTVSGGFSGLGIATTTPGGQLSVAVASGTSTALLVSNLGSNYTAYFEDSSADTSPFVIDSGGNVGIGTSAPTTVLDVTTSGTGPVSIFTIRNTMAAAADLGTSIDFRNNGVLASYIVNAWEGAATTNSYMSFATRGSGATAERMRINSSGNVGIGTTSPQTKLEVVNTSSGATADQLYLSNLASATSTASRLTFRANDITNGTSTANITSILTQNYNTGKGDLTFSTLRSGTLTEAMRILDTGFVGIGTTTPGSILSIQGVGNFITHGTSTLYNPLQVAGINATSSGITISGGNILQTSSASNTFSGGLSSTSGLFSSGLELSGGDLKSSGIFRFTGGATSTLSGGLSTAGLSSTAGLTLTGGTILSTGTGTSTFSGGIGATSLSASGGLTVSGGAILQTGGATSTILGLTSSGITSSSGFNITGGSISTNGLIYNTNTGTSTFSGGISIASAGGLTSGAGLTVTSGDILHTGATFRVTSGGNVGIGTTGPGRSLDVIGDATGSGGISIRNPTGDNINYLYLGENNLGGALRIGYANAAYTNPGHTPAGSALLETTGTNGGINIRTTQAQPIRFWTNSSNVSNTPQLILASGGNVGIGTTGPGVLFHVSGSAAASVVQQYLENSASGSASDAVQFVGRLTDTSGAQDSAGQIRFGKEQSWTSTVSTHDGFLSFYTLLNGSGAEYMRITSDGNVGIGTTGPGAKLDIGGTSVDVDAHIALNVVMASFAANHTSDTAIYAKADTKTGASATTNAYGVRIDTGSKSGVGALTNAYGLKVETQTTAGTSNYGVYIEGSSGATNNYGLYTNTGTTVLNATSGNVGIGTTSPTQLLSVSSSGGNSAYFAGSVGIGTNAPATLLHVGASATANPVIRLTGSETAGSDTYTYGLSFPSGSVDNAGMRLDFSTRDTTGLELFTTAYPITLSPSGGTNVLIPTSNLGIGTTTPGGLLSVSGGVTGPAFILNQTSTGALMTLQDSGNTKFTVIDGGNVGLGGTTTPGAIFAVSNGGLNTQGYFYNDANQTSANGILVETLNTAAATHILNLRSNATSRMVVQGDGNVGIGTTSPGTLLSVNTAGNFGGGLSALIASDLSETGAVCITASNTFSRETDGVCDFSALRFKEDISDIKYGLTELMQLKPKFYRFKKEFKGDFTLLRGGFIAEDVASIIPEAAEYEGYLNGEGVGLIENYDVRAVVATVVKAMQELNNKFSDDFELVETQTPEVGDLVQFSIFNDQFSNKNIEKATTTQKTIGVLTSVSASSSPVSFTGQTLVKVSDENGPVKAGDKITLSSIPGIGALATTSGQTIGIALEATPSPYQGEGWGEVIINSQGQEVRVKKIAVFVNLGYSQLGARDQGQGANTLDFFTLNNNPFTLDQSSGKIVSSYSIDLSGKDLLNVRAILSRSGLWSIGDDGKLFVQEITTEKLGVRSEVTLGSSEKRIGITLYDETTGDPYCLKVSGGVTITVSGICGTDPSQPSPYQGEELTATSSPPLQGGGTDGGGITDTTPPLIQIIGDNPATISVGTIYSDNGALVTDNVDSNLGYQTYLNGTLVPQIQLDTSTTTTHSIEYRATDQAGNTGTATRVVNVVSP